MRDVFLDDELEQDHDEDVASGLEDALVIPFGVLCGENAGDAIVLAQEHNVHDRVADRRVAMLKTDRKERIGLPLRSAPQDHLGDERRVKQTLELSLEHRWLPGRAASEQGLRIFLTCDQLALESPALHRAQQVVWSMVRP